MRQRWLLPCFISLLIIFIGFYTFTGISNYWQEKEVSISNPIINKVEIESQSLNLKSIIHEAEKSVIQIESESDKSVITGSGFIFNNQGDIITNAHVIKDADIIYVRTANAQVYPAAVVGISEEVDIAVIRVPLLAGRSSLSIEQENTVEIGDEVIALGSPHGFQNTVTLGIISGTERDFSVDNFAYKNAYQISAQISHGNSGGPLINRATGKVIGINSVGTEDGTIGFSIPIIDVMEQVEEWSNQVSDDELDFTSVPETLNTIDSEQLLEDTAYIIDYFFEGIQMRDYINAYTLLGSNIHTELSYADFRDSYTNIVELSYEIKSTEITDDNHAQATAIVTMENKQKNKKENKQNKVEYVITIGLENDQLKILKLIRP